MDGDIRNVLVIMSDQHNKSVIGRAGDPIMRTPNLDALADTGMLFTNAYTPAPLCVPARSAFMTSKNPSGNHVWDNRHILCSGALTWPHMMTLAGLESSLVGRMHFDGPDQYHGFEKRPFAGPFAVHPGMHMAKKIYKDGVPFHSGQTRVVMERTGGKGKGCYEVVDELATESACAYIREKAETGERFAAVTGFLLPHCPFIGDPDAFDYYYDALPDSSLDRDALEALPEMVRRHLAARGLDIPLEPRRVRACKAAYYAMIESMDKMIGRILDTLEETGLADDTAVFYVSDHGEQMNVHGCWCKSTFYEGSVGVPMIASVPGMTESGSRCDELVSLIDIGPTLLDLVGAESLPNADGISLRPLLKGGAGAPDRVVVSELHDSVGGVAMAMARKGPWKLWAAGDDSADILFNLENDPDENEDLASKPEYASVAAELRDEIERVCNFDEILTESRKKDAEHAFLAKWGEITRPELPERDDVPVDGQSFEIV